jgi:chemotaxis response regulator CheB
VASIRSVVITMSPLLTDIIEHLLTGHLDFEVIAEFANRNFSEEALKTICPDLVLVGLRPGESDEIGRSLLALIPPVKVIAFSSDARHGYLHEMRAHRSVIIDISPQTLLKGILTPDPVRR